MKSLSPPANMSYLEAAPRQVPGLPGLHRMLSMLLRERTPSNARILVLGAGGGMEIKALAEAQPGWTFDGIDPSSDMLRLAEWTLAPHAARVTLHQGFIDDAPDVAFDAAVCLLTFHFIAREERLKTLKQIYRRLQPGAPFVIAHISFPQTEPQRSLWLARHAAYGVADDTDPAVLERARHALGTRLTILEPAEEEAMLREAGFSDVSLFWAAFSFKGWVAYVPHESAQQR